MPDDFGDVIEHIIDVGIDFKNFGATPALDVRVYRMVAITNERQATPEFRETGWQDVKYSAFTTDRTESAYFQFSGKEAISILRLEADAYVRLRITYNDVFRQRSHTYEVTRQVFAEQYAPSEYRIWTGEWGETVIT